MSLKNKKCVGVKGTQVEKTWKFQGMKENCEAPGFKTDHSLITLHLTNNTNPRGPGFWKLNTSFFLESEYVNLIKETITVFPVKP